MNRYDSYLETKIRSEGSICCSTCICVYTDQVCFAHQIIARQPFLANSPVRNHHEVPPLVTSAVVVVVVPLSMDHTNAHRRRQSQPVGPIRGTSGGKSLDLHSPVSASGLGATAANSRMKMMPSSSSSTVVNDPSYINVRIPTMPETSRVYSARPYGRGSIGPFYQSFMQKNGLGSRPRSLCDSLILQSPGSNPDDAFTPVEYSPTRNKPDLERMTNVKPYFGSGERKTYSEWDMSRVGLDDMQPK